MEPSKAAPWNRGASNPARYSAARVAPEPEPDAATPPLPTEVSGFHARTAPSSSRRLEGKDEDGAPSSATPPPSPPAPPTPPPSPPDDAAPAKAAAKGADEEAGARPAPMARQPSMLRQLSRGNGTWARLNGYNIEETYRTAPSDERLGPSVEEQAEASAEADEAAGPLQTPAEAAHAAVGRELVTVEVAAQLQMAARTRALLNAATGAAAAALLEEDWLEQAGWRDRGDLLRLGGSALASRAGVAPATDVAAAAALLRGVLPSYEEVETEVAKATMVEVHEEDKEYAGGAFDGSRAELREALARITLQKVEDACKKAALQALEKQMGSSVAAEGLQAVVVNAVMRKVQPRMNKLCDVKTAGVLQYGIEIYLRLAKAAVPPRDSLTAGDPPVKSST